MTDHTIDLFKFQCLPSLLKKLCNTETLCLIDKSLERNRYLTSVLSKQNSQKIISVFWEIIEEPTYEKLDELFKEVSSLKPKIVVGIGGGSLLDYAKGVAILFKNKPPAISYRGLDKVKIAGVPCILVPSLAGSGAEVTATASFTDSTSKIKLGINGRYVSATNVLYDHKIYHQAPEQLKRKGIWDSLVHLIEATTSKSSNLLSKQLALDALKTLTKAASLKNESITKSKLNLIGSAKAALAMMAAGGGVTSGLSYPLGIYMKIPHAEAGGKVLLNLISAHIKRKYFSGYAFLSKVYLNSNSISQKQKAMLFYRNIKKHFFNPKKIRCKKLNISNHQLKFLVNNFLLTRKINYQADPVAFTRKELFNILKASF